MKMDDTPILEIDKDAKGRLILPSLVLSRGVTIGPRLVIGLLLIDIGLTFGYSVGVMGQIQTFNSIVALIFAIFTGALSVRFESKSLLLMGLSLLSISVLGCGLAPSYIMMLIFYSLYGLAIAITEPMTDTLVGEHFILDKRPSAIGWMLAGLAMIGVIGPPIIGYIVDFGGWRIAFLGFVLPIVLLGLLMAAIGLPSTSSGHRSTMRRKSVLEGYREIFTSRSAVACLIGTVLASATWQACRLYTTSLYRQQFNISIGHASIIAIFASLSYMLGSLVSGRFVNRWGRKLVSVFSVMLLGIFLIAYTNTPHLWISLLFQMFACLFAGLRLASLTSFILEQIPKFRGTMMSMSSAALSLGAVLGAGVGGLTLISYSYEGLGIFFGTLGIFAAAIYHLFAVDPTLISKQPSASCSRKV